jgi:hypothetical protein
MEFFFLVPYEKAGQLAAPFIMAGGEDMTSGLSAGVFVQVMRPSNMGALKWRAIVRLKGDQIADVT